MSKKKDDLLERLAILQLEDLVNLIESGQALPGHHATVRGLLKDNGVIINQESEEGNPLEAILSAIECTPLDD